MDQESSSDGNEQKEELVRAIPVMFLRNCLLISLIRFPHTGVPCARQLDAY